MDSREEQGEIYHEPTESKRGCKRKVLPEDWIEAEAALLSHPKISKMPEHLQRESELLLLLIQV